MVNAGKAAAKAAAAASIPKASASVAEPGEENFVCNMQDNFMCKEFCNYTNNLKWTVFLMLCIVMIAVMSMATTIWYYERSRRRSSPSRSGTATRRSKITQSPVIYLRKVSKPHFHLLHDYEHGVWEEDQSEEN